MDDKFTGSKAFLNIPVGIARDKELLKKPKTILLMGEIVSMLNVTGEFFMGNKKIAQRLGVSVRTVNDYLNILEKKKLIEREKVISKESDAIIGRKIRAGADLVKYISLGWCDELHEGSEVDFTTLVKPTSHKKNSIKEQYKRTTNKDSPADAEHHIPYKETVDYLNQKTSANYKSTTKPTVKQITKEFEFIWDKYPKKKGKKVAYSHYKAWRKTNPAHNTPQYLIKRLNAYIQHLTKDHTPEQYVLNGSTWFNGRFDDVLDVDKVQAKHGGFDKRLFENVDANTDDLPF